jgi:hypothetical protein
MEELLRPIRKRLGVNYAIDGCKLSPNDIDKILICGPTRMLMVRQFVATIMERNPNEV